MASTHHICWVKVDKCYNIPHPKRAISEFSFFSFSFLGSGTTEGSLKIASHLAVAFPFRHTVDNKILHASSLQALSSKHQE